MSNTKPANSRDWHSFFVLCYIIIWESLYSTAENSGWSSLTDFPWWTPKRMLFERNSYDAKIPKISPQKQSTTIYIIMSSIILHYLHFIKETKSTSNSYWSSWFIFTNLVTTQTAGSCQLTVLNNVHNFCSPHVILTWENRPQQLAMCNKLNFCFEELSWTILNISLHLY